MAMSTGKVVALIQAMGGADPAVIESAVQDWLDDHPEATTTVQDGSITEAKLASAVAQKVNAVTQLSDEIDNLIETHNPTNYGVITASSMVEGASALVGNVTATENLNGGIDVTNSSNANGIVAFPLTNLAYGTYTEYDFTLRFTNLISRNNITLRYSMTEGSAGIPINNFVQDQTDPDVYHFTYNLRNYPYSGNLFVSFELRYNQRTPVNVICTAFVHGDSEYDYVNLNLLHNIDSENLSKNLAERIGITPTTYSGKQICTFNKGVAVGDSLTEGVFNISVNEAIVNRNYSYPAKLGQITGINFVNLGSGGSTSATWWTNHSEDDLSGYQFAIIQLGVNDAIYNSGWTQESETAFTNIVEKLQNENTGIFIFVSTIIPATKYSGAAYNSVSQGIRDFVESLNDDHVILLDMAVYGNTGNEPAYNSGHLTALGYERLALDYISYISYIISQNYELFRKVQFIGTNYNYPTD